MPDKLTPEWEIYEDGGGQYGTADAPSEELDPTPNANYNYVNVGIILPRESKISRVRVTGRKHDIDVNTSGRALEIPILDMREYTLQFKDGELIELTEKVIVKSMYAQCYPDVNQYLLLDEIIDFRKTNSALSIKDQKIVVKGRASLCCFTFG